MEEDSLLSLFPRINTERATRAWERAKERAECMGLTCKMKKGLRLKCGSAQHTSIEAQIQAHPQQSHREQDVRLPGGPSLSQSSNTAVEPRDIIPRNLLASGSDDRP